MIVDERLIVLLWKEAEEAKFFTVTMKIEDPLNIFLEAYSLDILPDYFTLNALLLIKCFPSAVDIIP